MADSPSYIHEGEMRVPTYYAASGMRTEDYQTSQHARHRNFCGPAFITLIFGSIHCVGWNLKFPTYQEWLLWQISSFTMVSVSVVFILYAVHAAIQSSNKDYPQNGSKYGELIGRTLHQLCILYQLNQFVGHRSQASSIWRKVTVVTPKITKNLKKGSKNRNFLTNHHQNSLI